MEEYLREGEFERLVENTTGHAIFMVRPDGAIATWPSTAEKLYGYDSAEMVGSPLDRVWAEEGGESNWSLDGLLQMASEGTVDVEQWHTTASGSVFWASCTIAPVQNGTNHGFAVVTRDTTERKQYERMLERQNDRLKEFTDILSHDLRTPLTVVDARLALYRETGDEHHLEAIDETNRRMERLIDDLLSVAREGSIVKHPEPTDLAPIVEEAAFGTLPDRATLEYETVSKVMAEGDRLQQVFENLFRNAVEHGGPQVTVRVGPLSDGFFVEDDGPGIPEPDRAKVFDHGVTTREDGSGFGLSVVRTIAGSHGWDVAAVESSAGGARFEFRGTGVIA